MADQPHRAIRFIAFIVAASMIGATLGVLTTEGFTLGRILVSLGVVALPVVGAVGIAKNEPVLGALGGLGMLMLIEPLPELGVFLFLGGIGLILTAVLAVVESYLRKRRDSD